MPSMINSPYIFDCSAPDFRNSSGSAHLKCGPEKLAEEQQSSDAFLPRSDQADVHPNVEPEKLSDGQQSSGSPASRSGRADEDWWVSDEAAFWMGM